MAPSSPDDYQSMWTESAETIEGNIEYMNENYEELVNWLSELSSGKLRYGTLYD